MIKIGFVINYIVKNGPSNVVLNIINNLDKSKYDISLITLFSENDEEIVDKLREEKVIVYECRKLSRIKCILGKNKEFTDIVNEGNYDVLHTHGFIPDILSSRLKCSAKRISTIHNNMYEDYLDTYGYFKSRVFISLHLIALKKIDICVGCSKSVYEALKEKIKSITFIRNGVKPVDTQTDITREILHIPEDAKIFLYAGALNAGKNVVWLIDEFVKFHADNEYLLVLGSGDKESECIEKSDSHVQMLGFCSNPISYMNISDVYISASSSEGFSISILEALSSGLGLFLSNIPSHREIIEIQDEIYLGEFFDDSNFNSKLQLLRDKRFIKKKIRNFQIERLSGKAMTEQYDVIYNKKN